MSALATTAATATVNATQPVLVVGAGLAGLAAATQLVSQDVPVQLLERFPRAGGNSIKASSGINGAPTRFQPGEDSTEAFLRDTLRSAGACLEQSAGAERERREGLARALVEDSRDAIYWLADQHGVDLSTASYLGGHSAARTHRGGQGSKPPGFSIVSTLLENLKKNSLFELKTDTKVTKVIKEGEKVTGVEALI
ncbi:hypothetical protein KEM52_004783 [Ascosphaera acerosa]|nr:hypothetical protein KEM52_004783 [Ascosphaera acerosa]